MNTNLILQNVVLNKKIPGIVAIAANGDGVIYQGAFGKRRIDADISMTLDTVFWIASMTKPITSVAALQLVEKGKLQLDEPISQVIPELKAVQVLEGFDSGGRPKLRATKRPITLRHLLTHTSGYTFNTWNNDMLRYTEWANIPSILEGKDRTINTPLVFDPGERWEYGISTEWVGKAVEAASGYSLSKYVKEYVCNPIGMNDTEFILRPDLRSRLAGMHQRQPNGELSVIPPYEAPQGSELFSAGGGLYSTAIDYIKFLQTLLHDGSFNGTRILQPESVEQMGINQIGDLNVALMRSVVPSRSNDVDFFPGLVKKWSLGHMITTEEATTGRSAGSLAWAGSANTYYWIDPVKRLTGVFFTQLNPFMDETVLQAFAKFETEIYDSCK
ncbi:serine hydrolase [Psychrobacillus sp. OK032]|uniref:serine hydrolase domain-containing protein n=1 Tax=Psychrobacillus sp. OK032 TaxID=1884358 RepID=UPI0008B71B42|nr:serine hydrolase domain-containing protein [Psychrobacillus sp. OK032]SER82483.1 CubicO group peptidase, beta-lactamase class C family [Psychrobacillus sp. OK032]